MPPWVYGGVQLEGASLLYIRWEENGGRGKPLPYVSQENFSSLRRGGPMWPPASP